MSVLTKAKVSHLLTSGHPGHSGYSVFCPPFSPQNNNQGMMPTKYLNRVVTRSLADGSISPPQNSSRQKKYGDLMTDGHLAALEGKLERVGPCQEGRRNTFQY